MRTFLGICAVLISWLPAAASDSDSDVRGDFNGEGVEDSARLARGKDHVSVSVQLGIKGKAQVLTFRIDPASQDGICALPVELEVEPNICDPGDGPLPGCKELPGAVGLSAPRVASARLLPN